MSPIIKSLWKRMPSFVKKARAQLRRRYDSGIIMDKELVKDLMEFFDLSYDDTVCMLKLGRKLLVDFWNLSNPKTEDEILKFYETVPYQVFSLAFWHMSKSQRKFREEVVRCSFGDVLDYGGGIGDLCVKLAEKGLNVTYADVKGKTMEFAKWLFKKKGRSIKVVDLVKDYNRLEKYDTILCIDVIEHTPHPEYLLRRIAKHLRTDGRLIITNLICHGPTQERPMHFKIDFDAEKLLNTLGLFKADREWLWTKKL